MKDESKRAELARALDCFTSEELRALAGITESTEQAWRKRGVGPPYTCFGTHFLYPREAVAAFLRDRLRNVARPIRTTAL